MNFAVIPLALIPAQAARTITSAAGTDNKEMQNVCVWPTGPAALMRKTLTDE